MLMLPHQELFFKTHDALAKKMIIFMHQSFLRRRPAHVVSSKTAVHEPQSN
jgi:hypothetical protein